MKKRIRGILSAFLVLTLVGGSFALVGCGGSSDAAQEEQDNCYGEDMPVVNE